MKEYNWAAAALAMAVREYVVVDGEEDCVVIDYVKLVSASNVGIFLLCSGV